MIDIDSVLVKVQKLLNVEGRTPEEAAIYVEQAHAILAKYDLSIESVANLKADARTAVRKSDGLARETSGKPEGWKSDLLEAVARSFECRVMYGYEYETTKSGRERHVRIGQLIGFGHDVEAAGYAQAFLVAEITRLAKAYAKIHWDAIRNLAQLHGWSIHEAESYYTNNHGTHPLKAELYFIKGATQTVSESLVREANARKDEATRVNPNALTIQKSDAIRDFEYMERYGKTYADVKAEQDARNARWAEAEAKRAAESPGDVSEGKPETEAQCRRREAREAKERAKEERARRRQEQAYWNRYAREQTKIDQNALGAGQAAGRTIKVRRGIGGGIGEEGQIG